MYYVRKQVYGLLYELRTKKDFNRLWMVFDSKIIFIYQVEMLCSSVGLLFTP